MYDDLTVNIEDFIIKNGVLIKYIGKDKIVRIPDTVKELGLDCFDKTKVEELIIPGSVKIVGRTDNRNFYGKSFGDCPLKKVTLLDGVEEITPYAFKYYGQLEDINIPDTVKELGLDCFDKTKVEELIIPGSVKVVGRTDYRDSDGKSFGDCPLKKVTLLDGVEKITPYAFRYYGQLEDIKCLSKNIKIGNNAFDDTKIKNITFLADMSNIQGFNNSVIEHLTINTASNTLKREFLRSFPNLKSVGIPEGIEKIEDYAFYGTKIKSIKLPNTIKEIEKLAFASDSLTEIYLPSSLYELDKRMFLKAPKLETIFLSNETKEVKLEKDLVFDHNICAVYETIPFNLKYFELEKGMIKNNNSVIETLIIDNNDYKEILSSIFKLKGGKYLPKVNYNYMKYNIDLFKKYNLANEDIIKIYMDNENLLTSNIEYIYQNFEYLINQKLVSANMMKKLYFEEDDISFENIIKKYKETGKIPELLNSLLVEPNSYNQLELRDRLLSASTLNLLSDETNNEKINTAIKILNRDNFKTIAESDNMRFNDILARENIYHCVLSEKKFESVRYPIYEKINGYSKTLFKKLNMSDKEIFNNYINSLNTIKEWDEYNNKLDRANDLKNEFSGKVLLGVIVKMFNEQDLDSEVKIELNYLLNECLIKLSNNKKINNELISLQNILANYINDVDVDGILKYSSVDVKDMINNDYGEIAMKLMLKVDPYSFEIIKQHNDKKMTSLEMKYAIDAKKNGYLFCDEDEKKYKENGINIGNVNSQLINYIEYINNQISLPKIPKEEKNNYINSVRQIVKQYMETSSEEQLFKLYRAIDLFLRTENEYIIQKDGSEDLAKKLFDISDDKYSNNDRLLYCMYNLNRLAHDTEEISLKGDIINNYRIDLNLRTNINNHFMEMLKSSNVLSKYNLSLEEIFNLIDTKNYKKLFDDIISNEEKINIIDNSRLSDIDTKEEDLEKIINSLAKFKGISKQINSDSTINIEETKEKLKYISNQYILFFETKNILQEEMIKRFGNIEDEISRYNIYELDTLDKKRTFYKENGFIMEFQKDGRGDLLLVIYNSKFDEPFSLHIKNFDNRTIEKIESSGCLNCPTISHCQLTPTGLTAGNTYKFNNNDFVYQPGFTTQSPKSCLLYNYMTYDIPIIKSKEEFQQKFLLTNKQKQMLGINDEMFNNSEAIIEVDEQIEIKKNKK